MTTPTPGDDEVCGQCGHKWNDHLIYGQDESPTEGWMECPVEGCACRMTWSLDPAWKQVLPEP